MSKIGNWVMEMQEDAAWSSKEVFIRKHGVSNEIVWTEVRRQMAEDSDVDVEDYWGTFDMEMDDGS
tara:strand:- start:433 stop:630 length:198 start_codon:yes stop_codon:yes gene_type:complete